MYAPQRGGRTNPASCREPLTRRHLAARMPLNAMRVIPPESRRSQITSAPGRRQNEIVSGNATMDENTLRKMWQQDSWRPFADYEEWVELVKRAYDVLVEAARSKRLITYGEIGSQIDLFSPEYFEVKIGSVVGACSVYEHHYGRPLISAIAVNAGTREASEGFWGLPGISPTVDRVVFWTKEVERVFRTWAGGKQNAARS